jgi:hypothetical protein
LLASAIDGSLLVNLANIVAAAGKIPFANLNVPFGSTYVSLVSIPNASLLPIALTSWVDATSFKSIQSIPTLAGQLSWYSVVGSLASGAAAIFNGTNQLVGGSPGTTYVAGDFNILSANTERSTSSASFTKLKEFLVPGGGVFRVLFDLRSDTGSGNALARIYRNGVEVGTQQASVGTSYSTFTEDLGGWLPGDLCQLYVRQNGGVAFVRNFKINVLGTD